MTRVVFCPSPPLLPAGDLVGHVEEVEATRAAAAQAVEALVASAPTSVVVVAREEVTGPADAAAGGTLAAHGIDVAAGSSGDASLGLGHTVGAWLLDSAGWDGPRRYASTVTADELGDDVGVLVVADGSATRTDKAPGHLDERAEAFDAAIASALRDGDADALGGIDLDLADELWCRGAATLRSVGDALAARMHRDERQVSVGAVRDEAPLGVGWFVADWRLG